MKQVDRIFAHGGQRAKSHDLRFGQYLINAIYKKYGDGVKQLNIDGIIFNMENPEMLEMVRGYND